MNSKKEFRKKYLSARINLNLDLKQKYDQKIFKFIINDSTYKNSKIIAGFMPIKNEFDFHLIIIKSWFNNKIVVLPRMNSNYTLTFYQINSFADLVLDKKSKIYQPNKKNKVVNLNDIDIIFLPFLAYNKEGYRLGYGYGYYDRTLVNYKKIIIGLGYSFQEENALGFEKYDQKVNYIMNESEKIKIK